MRGIGDVRRPCGELARRWVGDVARSDVLAGRAVDVIAQGHCGGSDSDPRPRRRTIALRCNGVDTLAGGAAAVTDLDGRSRVADDLPHR